ncbi:hypothetical protein CHS0354_040627 [Potamilus streckersoni]|uniref:Peptidase M12B domain-containing protein n=1 Tax=Potamilus streckersoni TaxID=2493646 RepID=A0AAE0SGQ3_9BIVA|nr:hypothetical protein CHS0354_040627 [Potamilus streckersoni]
MKGTLLIYASTVSVPNMLKKRTVVKQKIRESYSHVVNGVSLIYKGLKEIKIRITLSGFIIFQNAALFPHNSSKVTRFNGTTYIDIVDYHDDLTRWDAQHGADFKPNFDHAMLFTRHELYEGLITINDVYGLCWNGMVCVPGKRTSVVQTEDYVATVLTAAHELGHRLKIIDKRFLIC